MTERQTSWRVRLSFGVGAFAEGAKNSAFQTFILFYYTNVLGLSGSLTGIALLIALCFDGISDPLMGTVTDNYKSRWERRHPFMYGAAVPFALSFFYLFVPPSGIDQLPLFLWLTVFSVLTRGMMTVYSVPHITMNAELSNDYKERATLSSILRFFSLVGTLAVASGGMLYFFRSTPDFAKGQLNPEAYPVFAGFFAVVMVIVIWLSALGTHSEIPRLPQRPEDCEQFSFRKFYHDVKKALAIQDFLLLVGSGFLFSAAWGTMLALLISVCTFYWELSSREIGIITPVALTGVIIGTVLVRPLLSAFGEKKRLFVFASFWYSLFVASTIVLRIFGLMPPNGHWLIVPAIAITNMLGYAGWGVISTIKLSMLADITDEHERVHAARQEGFYFGISSLMVKIASGAGTLVAGIVSDLTGIAKLTDSSSVDPDVLLKIGLIYGPLPVLAAVIASMIIRTYSISSTRHTEILAEIDNRKKMGTT